MHSCGNFLCLGWRNMCWNCSSNLHRSPYRYNDLHCGWRECRGKWDSKCGGNGHGDYTFAKLHLECIPGNGRLRRIINVNVLLHSRCNVVCLDWRRMCHKYNCDLHCQSNGYHFVHSGWN